MARFSLRVRSGSFTTSEGGRTLGLDEAARLNQAHETSGWAEKWLHRIALEIQHKFFTATDPSSIGFLGLGRHAQVSRQGSCGECPGHRGAKPVGSTATSLAPGSSCPAAISVGPLPAPSCSSAAGRINKWRVPSGLSVFGRRAVQGHGAKRISFAEKNDAEICTAKMFGACQQRFEHRREFARRT